MTAGTVLHRTRMPLQTWFWGAYLVTAQTPGMSALQFQRQLGLGRYETGLPAPAQASGGHGAT